MTDNTLPALALFDLDHTLLPIDSDKAWVSWLASRGLAGDPEAVKRKNDELMSKYEAGTLDISESAAFMLSFLAMHTPFELAAYHEQYMADVIRPEITPAAVELVDRHLSAGHLCCLVSATNSYVIEPIARAFGFEHVIGTTPERRDGRFTGRFVGEASYQHGKVIRVEQWLKSLGLPRLNDFPESYFYSDSINDLPLLEQVTCPAAVNPQDSLRDAARERGWKIIDIFSKK